MKNNSRYLRLDRLVLIVWMCGGLLLTGCGSSKEELPSKEKIEQQLKRDAEMRAEEDRLEREAAKR
ncbi:MAG: hypothetical protein WD738_22290 [Pirellulales bacterium]